MKESLFDAYIETTPNVSEYLKRIGYNDELIISLDCLNRIIQCHQLSVPFEDLDVYNHKIPIKLDIDSLFEKIVMNHRGGYCFENNASMCSLLRAIGFNARPCMCRVVRSDVAVNNIRHRGTIVELDDKSYFVDVGFGGCEYYGAIEINLGLKQKSRNEVYYFESFDKDWLELHAISPYHTPLKGITEAVDRPILLVSTFRCIPDDFLGFNMLSYSASNSSFVRQRRAIIKTLTGINYLMGNELVIINGQDYQKIVLDDSQINEALAKYFGIVID